ncbi:MAG: hypothetical protein H6728_17905 [Myxococcales bacterium]|nr:hypothetical protein [Myxococcales bacterium]MCB9644951.1 hypothetical protein [Myxococcales bacterium]
MQDQDKIPVFLSYLGFVGLVPPFAAYFFLARSPYARFHAQQGILLTLLFLFGGLGIGITRWVMLLNGQPLRLVYLVAFSWFVIYIVCNLIAAVLGLWGRTWKIPFLHRMVRIAQ